MKRINKKVLLLVSTLIALILIIFLILYYLQSKAGASKDVSTQEAPISNVTNGPGQQLTNNSNQPQSAWAKKSYRKENNVKDPFSVQYPNDYTSIYSDGGGQWDLTLTKGSTIINIDMSGLDTNDITSALNFWMNDFGSYEKSVDYVVVENGINQNENYKVFTVNTNGVSWTYGVEKVGQSTLEGSNIFIAVRINSTDNASIQMVKKILYTISRS